MCEKTKPKKEIRRKNEQNEETRNQNLRDCEEAEKSYYYDDAHGYETYKPEIDDEKEDGN